MNEDEVELRRAEEGFLLGGVKGRFSDQKHRHQCNMGCNYELLRPGQSFNFEGRSWVATGEVWVCKDYKTVHQCGVGWCRTAVDDDGGKVCTTTGLFMAQAMSLARNGCDIDIRVCGDTSYKHGSYVFDVDATLEHEVEVEEETSLASDATTLLADVKKDKVLNLDDIYGLFKTNIKDVNYVLWAYPGVEQDVLLMKIAELCEWRKQATHAWAVRAHGVEYMRRLKHTAYVASLKWTKAVDKYMRTQMDKGLPWDRLHILNMWVTTVRPKYDNVYHGGDVVAMNERHKDYYIQTMLNLWERWMSMPELSVPSTRFKDCCTAILTMMSEGFYITVYMVDGDEKPYHHMAITAKQQKKVEKVVVWVINAHPKLHLVSSDIVRKVQTQMSARKSAERDTTSIVSSAWCGKRICTKKRQSVTNKKKPGTQKSSRMPPLKLLHSIVNDIVKYSSTLAELESYCMQEVNRRAMQHMGRSLVI